MSLSPVFVELKASIGEFQAKMGEARGELTKLDKKGAGTSDKLAAAGKGAALGLGAVAVGVGAFSLKMADDYEKAHARLETSVRNSGVSIETLKKPISNVEKQMEHFGFTNAQTEDALSHLTTATNDPKKALSEMGLAANIAKARGIDLSSASDLLSKALSGNLRPLKQMGIDLPITASNALKLKNASTAWYKAQDGVNAVLAKFPDAANPASKAHDKYLVAQQKVTDQSKKLQAMQQASGNVLDALSQRFKGSAATAAGTFAGKVAAVKAQAQDMGKNLGMKLIPILEKLMTTVMKVVTWLGKHQAVAKTLAAVIGGIVLVAIGAYIVSMISAAVATLAAVWPILLIIIAIALVGAAIFLLAKNWKKVWNNIKQWAGDAWHWLEDNVIHPVADAFTKYITDPVKDSMEKVKLGWQLMSDKVSQVWSDIKQWIKDGVAVIKRIVGDVKDAFVGLYDAFTDPFRKAWDFIKDIPDKIKGALAKIPGGGILKDLHVPGFAVGTSYAPGGMAWVGESGPELVDLPQGARVNTAAQSRAIAAAPTRPVSHATTNNITVNVQGSNASPMEIAQATARALDRRERALRR